MIVDAHIWYWTPLGMREGTRLAGNPTGYIEQREVERLLEEADLRRLNAERDRRGETPL